MRVYNIRRELTTQDEHHVARLTADVAYADGERGERYWFEVPALYSDSLTHSGNPWLLALLPLAMRLGEPLEIDAPIDRVLLANARESVDIWRYWDPEIHKVTISAPLINADNHTESGVAAFFSGGVDSFYTLLTHTTEEAPYNIDDLLCIWGFDVPLDQVDAFAQMQKQLTHAAHQLAKNLIPIKTNLRETRVERASNNGFGPFYHGYALGAVALILERRYQYILVPSNGVGPEESPWGTHPLTVPLLSSNATRFVWDPISASRLEKLRLLAKSKVAENTLHVCFKLKNDQNCGRCEKCYRTQLGLELLGARERFTTFNPEAFSLDEVPNLYMYSQNGDRENFYQEMQTVARELGKDKIAAAIERGFKHGQQYKFWLPIRNQLWELPVIWRLGRLLDRLFIDRITR